jgi:hypothetical protein
MAFLVLGGELIIPVERHCEAPPGGPYSGSRKTEADRETAALSSELYRLTTGREGLRNGVHAVMSKEDECRRQAAEAQAMADRARMEEDKAS